MCNNLKIQSNHLESIKTNNECQIPRLANLHPQRKASSCLSGTCSSLHYGTSPTPNIHNYCLQSSCKASGRENTTCSFNTEYKDKSKTFCLKSIFTRHIREGNTVVL